ncbi:hypothetical protein [Aeromonas bivalvium]|uniref:hypothetical protein n=1 Tax=Aeromonas bivalvium TaxID=440079 RepID=UPI003D22B4A2
MSLNVTLPPGLPTTLQPQTDAARSDNRRAELIPRPPEGAASGGSQKSASQQDQARQAHGQGPGREGVGKEGDPPFGVHPGRHRVEERESHSGHGDGQQGQGEGQDEAGRARESGGGARTQSFEPPQTGLQLRPAGPPGSVAATGGVLNAYMELRSQAIAQRYRGASRPAAPQQLDLRI